LPCWRRRWRSATSSVERPAALFVDCRCHLAEGIVSWPERSALLWTDIHACRLWIKDAGGARAWAVPDRLGSFAICESGKLLLGLAKGLYVADIGDAADGVLPATWIADVEPDLPSTRLNDGRTDRAGRFVFGTMNEEEGHPATGSFYQWSTAAGLRRLDLPRVGIANSICFSRDGNTMYFCDSPTRRIMQCRYDSAAAAVADVREFAVLPPDQGQPDGSVVDADGCLWNAAWGIGLVRRYRSDGTIEREIPLPAKNPTCVVFGGAALNELYITTARQDMSPLELERVPHAGGIYRAEVIDVAGLRDAPFRDRL
jgi:sugar lactone lactonase YvrE